MKNQFTKDGKKIFFDREEKTRFDGISCDYSTSISSIVEEQPDKFNKKVVNHVFNNRTRNMEESNTESCSLIKQLRR